MKQDKPRAELLGLMLRYGYAVATIKDGRFRDALPLALNILRPHRASITVQVALLLAKR